MDRITALWKNQGILGDLFRGVVKLLGICFMIYLAMQFGTAVQQWAQSKPPFVLDQP